MLKIRRQSSISKALAVCKAVASGDFEARILNITEKGEMGELMHAINNLVDRTDANLRESKAAMQYVARNQYFRRIAEKGMVGDFGRSADVINQALELMASKCNTFSGIARDFETHLEDVVGQVSASISELQELSGTVKSLSESTSEKSTIVAAGAEQASANMQGVAGATEELTSSINEINQQAVKSADVTFSAVSKVHSLGEGISALEQASEKISQVIQLINDIANQTNLLALNATIEAARAGEAGKGFAVVASEVKVLATQTEQATQDIARQIEEIKSTTAQTVTANQEISETMSQVNEYSTSISTAVEEQGAATCEIAKNVQEAATGTTDVSASIAQVQDSNLETLRAANEVFTASTALIEQKDVLLELKDKMKTFNAELSKVG